MRFYEFSNTNYPILKISQQQQARQGLVQNSPPTTWPANTVPTNGAESIKVNPQEWQHDWIQKYLAATIAKDAQTVAPSEEDIVRAYMRFADAQRKADKAYEKSKHSEQADDSGWKDDHR